jgi:DNA primase
MDHTALSVPEPVSPEDIVELVGQHTTLRPNEQGQLRGSCPFCGSRAFVVRPKHGTFHCFGCGDGGDARMFTIKIQHRG